MVQHIDINSLTGDEMGLVKSIMTHHTAAAREVIEDLTVLEIPVPRARAIILQTLLMLAGVDAIKQQIDVATFAGLALTGHITAGEMLAISHDIRGAA